MTNREMLVAVVNGEITEEVMAQAQIEIDKLDAKNEKRRTTASSKKAEENAPIVAKIRSALSNVTEPMLASDIANLCEVSTSKVSALLRPMVENGTVDKIEVRVPKVGKRFAYSLIR